MNLSAHVAVGATVGYFTGNPALGFVAGFLSHHVIDALPHTDGGSFKVNVKDFAKDIRIIKIVAIDLVLMTVIGLFLYTLHGFYLPMVLGAIGGAMPDIIDNMPFWSPRLRKIFPFNYYHRFHEYFHFTIENEKWLWTGIATQIILILISFGLLV